MKLLYRQGVKCGARLDHIRHSYGTLMPPEFDVFNFHQWLRRKLGEPLYTPEVASC